MYLLQLQLGVACAIPIGVAIGKPVFDLQAMRLLIHALVSFLGSLGATSLVMQRQALWLEAIERRITATAAMLNSMKGVKMCGLTDVLRDDLQRLRIDELDISKKFRRLLIWTMMICQSNPFKLLRLILTRSSLYLADCITHPRFRSILDTCSKKQRL
jgi:ATP-binding cassette subfamily C (CFTR/MRP) protein 1